MLHVGALFPGYHRVEKPFGGKRPVCKHKNKCVFVCAFVCLFVRGRERSREIWILGFLKGEHPVGDVC